MGYDRNDYLPVSRFAKLVEKTPQTIYKKLKAGELQRYSKTENGKVMIRAGAAWDLFGVDINPDGTISEGGGNNQTADMIALLTEQLKEKDRHIAQLTEAILNSQKLQAQLSAKITMLEDKLYQQAANTEPVKEQSPEPSSSDGDVPDSQSDSKAESDTAERPENTQKEKSPSSYGLDIQQSKRPSSIQPHTAPKRKRPEYLSSKRQKSVYEAYRPTERGFRGFLRKVLGF